MTPSTALASVQERIRQDLESTRNNVPPPSGLSITIKGKSFHFPDGQTSQGPIQLIVLDYRNLYRYFKEAYNPQKLASPSCFALSKSLEGMAPHESAPDPVSDVCKGCPMNEWGSASQGKGKACKNNVKLAVVAPDATIDTDPFSLIVSPTGLKSWSSFVNGLAVMGRVPIQAVAEVSFDPQQAYPTLKFKAVAAVEEEKITMLFGLRDKAQALLDRPPLTDE